MRSQFNETMPSDYRSLQERSRNPVSSPITAVQALRNTCFMIGILEGDAEQEELVAFGRVVGDEARYFLVCDVMVDERLEGQGYEVLILKELEDYIRVKATGEAQVLALVDRPYDEICRKLGFRYLDEDFRTAMVRSGGR